MNLHQESGPGVVGKTHSHPPLVGIGGTTPVSEPNRSVLNALQEDMKKRDDGEKNSEVILTTARPATVISNASTGSSPVSSETKLSKEER